MKQKMSFLVLAALVAVIALVASGCPKPTAEMNRAQEAIAQARAAQAGQFASTQLASAERLMAEGQDLVKKLRYEEARERFEQAYRLAAEAREIAVAAQQPVTQPVTPVVTTHTTVVQPRPPVVAPPAPAPTTESHTVVRGECLWRIAEYEKIYDDPFQWPLIYWENQTEIDNTAHQYGHRVHEENWIYPDQEFNIPRNVSLDQIKKARRRAGAPAPYTPPGQ